MAGHGFGQDRSVAPNPATRDVSTMGAKRVCHGTKGKQDFVEIEFDAWLRLRRIGGRKIPFMRS
jgi:hypothetical protein